MVASVIWGSVIFATLIMAVFLLLVVRRMLGERRIKREGKAMLGATKDVLLRIQDLEPSAPSAVASAPGAKSAGVEYGTLADSGVRWSAPPSEAASSTYSRPSAFAATIRCCPLY